MVHLIWLMVVPKQINPKMSNNAITKIAFAQRLLFDHPISLEMSHKYACEELLTMQQRNLASIIQTLEKGN